MNLDKYEIKGSAKSNTFRFTSVGRKGKIIKTVEFTPTGIKNIFNLGFGDLDVETNKYNDKIISNNGDGEKVLSTVVSTLFVFFEKNKNSSVYATGSTKSRTRLYQIGINKHYDRICEYLEIFGELDHGWERFKKNRTYIGFLVRLKN